IVDPEHYSDTLFTPFHSPKVISLDVIHNKIYVAGASSLMVMDGSTYEQTLVPFFLPTIIADPAGNRGNFAIGGIIYKVNGNDSTFSSFNVPGPNVFPSATSLAIDSAAGRLLIADHPGSNPNIYSTGAIADLNAQSVHVFAPAESAFEE